MPVHFETTGGILRVYAAGKAPPDPYRYAIAVVADEGRAVLKALNLNGEKVTADDRREIRAALEAAGMAEVVWYRKRGERRRMVTQT